MYTSTKQVDPAKKYATADSKKFDCWIYKFCGKVTMVEFYVLNNIWLEASQLLLSVLNS